MISHRGYTIEQYPSKKKIVITVPDTESFVLLSEQLATVLIMVENMIEEDKNDVK